MPKTRASVRRPVAAGYVRVSRDKTKHGGADEIVSPDTQKEFFKRFAEMRGFQMPADLLFEDLDYSGYRMHYSKRPGLMQLLKLAEEGRFQYLLIYKISRLSRRLREFLELYDRFEKAGVGIISVTESIDTSSPYGRAAMHMLAVFAQLQSDELSEYISNTKATQARQGVMPGARSPYGLVRTKGQVTQNPKTFPFLQKMFEMAAAGASGREISQWLQEAGAPAPAGDEWWAVEVRRILQNPVYIGKFQFGGQVMDGRHETFIDEGLFYRAQKALDERTSIQANKRSRSLSGVIVCGSCGALYNVHHGGGHAKELGYQCRNRFRRKCRGPRVDAATLEQEVYRRLTNLLANPEALAETRRKTQSLGRRDLGKEKARLEAELTKVKKMLDTLFDYVEQGTITQEQFAEQNRRYLDRARETEMRLAALLAQDPKAESREFADRLAALGGLLAVWEKVDEEERSRVLRGAGLRLIVHEDHVKMNLLGIHDTIAGFAPQSTLYFGPAVIDLHFRRAFWSRAQEDYLLANWERQTVEQIAAAIDRPTGGVRQKVIVLRKAGKLRSKR